MRVLLLVVAGIACWMIWTALREIRQRARRRLALAAPFPDEWDAVLERNLRPYSKLSPVLRTELQQHMKLFLAEKKFEGCGGLELADEMKVTIAAQACLLLLNRNAPCYPNLHNILVYPTGYVAGTKGLFRDPAEDVSGRLGESWPHGTVVLSWSDVKQGAFNFCDGHNVAMHEFAHQLDQEDGIADGAPVLERRSAYSSWGKVLSAEFEQMKRKGWDSVLDSYGATNPAEFFAVATETFFEKPAQLRKKHPQLYEELQHYYKTNPLDWA